MSGGSYNYIYNRLLDECENRMYDAEMNDLINDLCEVLHDLEWWQSCDISEEDYKKTLRAFKRKWLNGDREQRLKGYIDEQISILRSQLYSLIGEPQESEDKACKDCYYNDGKVHAECVICDKSESEVKQYDD